VLSRPTRFSLGDVSSVTPLVPGISEIRFSLERDLKPIDD
jgi:hypothetical protein